MNKFFYEIHVQGKNGFSTSIISDTELDKEQAIMLAYEQDKLDGDDCHYVDYVTELTYEQWNDYGFNFNDLQVCDICDSLVNSINDKGSCTNCNMTAEHSSFMNGGK